MAKGTLKSIGGYFELELPPSNTDFVNSNGIFVNSGQNALEYILMVLGSKIKKLFLPYYTCDVVLKPILRLGIDYEFYHINKSLEIFEYPDLKEGEYIIVNNYFGIKDRYINEVFIKYNDKLIVDNAQAWYSSVPENASGLYSPRKFYGIPDGGIAVVNGSLDVNYEKATSYDKCNHLLKRIDLNPENGYNDFKEFSEIIANEPIMQMSSLSYRILSSINFERVKEKRRSNFKYIHNILKNSNKLTIPDIDSFVCPMVYPYLPNDLKLRDKLINNKVYVATYWPNVFDWCEENSTECFLAQGIVPLPIDQRYGEAEMKQIVNIIHKLH